MKSAVEYVVTNYEELLNKLSEQQHSAAIALLGRMTREKLIEELSFAYFHRKRLNALLINQELTKRGIAPCFRAMPHKERIGPDLMFDIVLADAEWIASRYPDQKGCFARYERLFKPSSFHSTARFLFYQGKTPIWRMVKGLALTEDQQLECHLLHSGPVNKRLEYMRTRKPAVDSAISHSVMSRRTGGLSGEEQRKVIKRRQGIWQCGFMANSSPQRTADLFEMMTGEILGRNLIAKNLDKIKRDIRALH